MTTKKPIAIPEINPLAVRKKRGENQTTYWNRVGITQSGGSRLESGRRIPKPVQILLALTYGSERQAEKVLRQLREGKRA